MPVVAEMGGKTTVYKFEMYDIVSDEFKMSRRRGTPRAIEKLGGRQIPGPLDVPHEYVDADGLTKKDLDLA